jgi:rod shape-determining protein MreC
VINTLYLKSPSANVRIIIFVLASIILMTMDHKLGHLEKLRTALSIVVYPLQYTVNVPVHFFNWTTESLSTRQNLLAENKKLRKESLLLSSKLQKFEVLETENKRLRKLLESSLKLQDKVLIAELLSVNLQPFRHQVIINKGQHEGVYNGQPIVDANGIMGQVIHVGPFSSTVLLITDPTHALPVQINRNGLRAIAVGTGQGHSLQLEYLSNNADIREGDLIVSSGLGSRFPAGYPVGIVNTISMDPAEPFAKVSVTPSARLEQSREVLLVWPRTSSGIADKIPDFAKIP